MEDVARRLAVSPRTLQRRLAERGTTWRAELDTVRRFRAQQARQFASPTMASLATRLAYSDVRSVRRAIRRWEHTPQEEGHKPSAAP
jgi:AraC-like DNA-binding protein